jgi:hypothetical protein
MAQICGRLWPTSSGRTECSALPDNAGIVSLPVSACIVVCICRLLSLSSLSAYVTCVRRRVLVFSVGGDGGAVAVAAVHIVAWLRRRFSSIVWLALV